MRVALIISLLLIGCGHKGSSDNRTLATLPDSDGTPVWLGIANDQLLVGVAHGEVGSPEMSLIAINPSSGEHHQLAGSLPAGTITVHDAKLLLTAYIGELGSVDLSSGAYTKLVGLDGPARAAAVTPQGYVVGMSGHLELYGPDGTHHVIAGSEVVHSSDFNDVISTHAGVFAASQLGGTVLRVDGDHATVVADKQQIPESLAATQTDLVWTTGEGNNVGQHLVAMPLTGGTTIRLADAAAPALISNVATTDTVIACTTLADPHHGEILTVKRGSAPKKQVPAAASLLAVAGNTIYWVEETTAGWAIHALPIST